MCVHVIQRDLNELFQIITEISELLLLKTAPFLPTDTRVCAQRHTQTTPSGPLLLPASHFNDANAVALLSL